MATPINKARPRRIVHKAASVMADLANKVFVGRDQIKRIDDDVKTAQEELVGIMQNDGRKTATVPNQAGTGDLSITLVEGSTMVLDEAKLKVALGAQMWNKVTTRVLDRKKLDAFVASGEINPLVIARASSEKPRTPFVKVVPKRGS